MSGKGQPLSPWRWLAWPMLQACLATLVFAAPIRIFGLGLPEPVFPMAAAFAWGVIRPSFLAPLGVLAMGLVLDLLWGGPLGLWALALLAAYGAALFGRNMMAGQSFVVLAGWFAGATALAMVVGYLVTTLVARAAPGLVGIGWQFLATILLYPFSHRLIERFEDADVRFR